MIYFYYCYFSSAQVQKQTMGRPSCPICLETYTHFTDISAGACGHTFHRECLEGWRNECWSKKVPVTCPICVLDFTGRPQSGIVVQLYFSCEDNSSPSWVEECDHDAEIRFLRLELERKRSHTEETQRPLLRKARIADGEARFLRQELEAERKCNEELQERHRCALEKMESENDSFARSEGLLFRENDSLKHTRDAQKREIDSLKRLQKSQEKFVKELRRRNDELMAQVGDLIDRLSRVKEPTSESDVNVDSKRRVYLLKGGSFYHFRIF